MSIAKKVAGKKAAEVVMDVCRDGCLIGIGTGSTIKYFIEEANNLNYLKKSLIVTTSIDTALTLRMMGINNVESGMCISEALDVYVDGADEVDPKLRMIKGRGAALLREKVLATNSKYRVYVVDESKIVKILGTKKPVPIEVIPFAILPVMRSIESMGYRVELRVGSGKDGPVISDNGNVIMDIYTGPMNNPEDVHRALKLIVGVVETGIFIDLVDEVIVGSENGEVKILRRS